MSFLLIKNNKDDYILIPNEAIRVRVIANSDSEYDVAVKEKLKDEINNELNHLLNGTNSINDVRIIINENLDFINSFVDKSLKKLNYNKAFSLNYGSNFFPEKIFKGVLYKSGLYESLVITLGDGKGPNYWCVLYPPLCSIEEKSDKYEYRLFIKDILNKYLN